jgi:tRNA(His) 5'-end guanylyltransferase
MNKDDLGDRMKGYEMTEAGRMLMPGLPVMIRLDGKAFHTFTKGLERPFDKRLTDLMVDTTKFLVESTNAVVGYTQSDEISLILYTEKPESQLFFDGRIQKLTSVITSMATAFFNRELPKALPEKADKFAYFDCRVWNVPNVVEAVNALVWRELDATKNAISMAAQHYYSHQELQNKNGKEKQEMLFQKGVNFNDYPCFFKRGSYVRRVKKFIKFSAEELEKLPAKHAARTNPNLLVERSVIQRAHLPPITKIVNRVDVFLNGAEPVLASDEKEDII